MELLYIINCSHDLELQLTNSYYEFVELQLFVLWSYNYLYYMLVVTSNLFIDIEGKFSLLCLDNTRFLLSIILALLGNSNSYV